MKDVQVHRRSAPGASDSEGLVEEEDGLRAECVRIAAGLRRSGRRVIGLLPVTESVGVVGAALQLASAMCRLSGEAIAVVDANLRWPAFTISAEHPTSDPGRGTGAAAFEERWIEPSMALLVPRHIGAAGESVPVLGRALADGRQAFEHLLVDLTGFSRLGEIEAAIGLLDGVVLIARSGRSTEDEIMQRWREVPDPKRLGVLLTGVLP